MKANLNCFTQYDIRGKLGDELTDDVVYRIGKAYADFLKPSVVVIGGDVRLSTEGLKSTLINALNESGVDTIDIGLAGSEEVYFATQYFNANGGIEVTASHNPANYNGMKLVREQAKPISNDSGLDEIKQIAEFGDFSIARDRGLNTKRSCLDAYIGHLMSYINPSCLGNLKLVLNVGNGAAGHVIDAIEEWLCAHSIKIELIKLNHNADGSFPNGVPNPLLPDNREETTNAVIKHQADMGIAWDGDFDRCFLFDDKGRFVEGYYIVGLLAEAFLQKNKGEKIIHDPRLIWNTIEQVEENGGVPIQSKTGHAFIKERMRSEDAIYGGEMSAHHYFRDFGYCDSGMIPWLLISELISTKKQPLQQLVNAGECLYPCSGEINYRVNFPKKIIQDIYKHYQSCAVELDETDGISMIFEQWRFNLRQSNTEPVIRLNVESKNDKKLVFDKVEEIASLIINLSSG